MLAHTEVRPSLLMPDRGWRQGTKVLSHFGHMYLYKYNPLKVHNRAWALEAALLNWNLRQKKFCNKLKLLHCHQGIFHGKHWTLTKQKEATLCFCRWWYFSAILRAQSARMAILDSCLAPFNHWKTFNLHILSTVRSEKAVFLGSIKLAVHHTSCFGGIVLHQIQHPQPAKVWPPRVTEIEVTWWESSKSEKTKKHNLQ